MAIATLGVFGAFPSQASAEPKMTGGTTACNGTFFYRQDVDEVHMGTWNFANYNDDVTIKVDRAQIFTADGVRVVDFPNDGLPPPPFTKTVLLPHQSTQLRFHDMFGGPAGYLQDKNKRPVQLIVDWSIPDGRGYAPDAETVVTVRVGGGGFLGGTEIARNSVKCRLIRSEWR